MDDFTVTNIKESRNELCAQLLNILTPCLLAGFMSILGESIKISRENKEYTKYLKTFQHLLTQVPKWNAATIEKERRAIIEQSNCSYLEDLISSVHILQLKLMSTVRVGPKQKKINIVIPQLDTFIHKAYWFTARKIYSNSYLFVQECDSLEQQRNQHTLEGIIQEGIMTAIRDSIPVETILKAYLDESIEEDVVTEIKDQDLPPAPAPVPTPAPAPMVQSISVPTQAHPSSFTMDMEPFLPTPTTTTSIQTPSASTTIDPSDELFVVGESIPMNLDEMISMDLPSTNTNTNNNVLTPDIDLEDLPDLQSLF